MDITAPDKKPQPQHESADKCEDCGRDKKFFATKGLICPVCDAGEKPEDVDEKTNEDIAFEVTDEDDIINTLSETASEMTAAANNVGAIDREQVQEWMDNLQGIIDYLIQGERGEEI